MKIEFKKVGFESKEFSLVDGKIQFFGEFKKDKNNPHLIIINGKIVGDLFVNCDRCGVEFTKELNEDIEIFASNGIYEKENEEEDAVVIEFFDQKIDFSYIFESEIASIISDYHICPNCEEN